MKLNIVHRKTGNYQIKAFSMEWVNFTWLFMKCNISCIKFNFCIANQKVSWQEDKWKHIWKFQILTILSRNVCFRDKFNGYSKASHSAIKFLVQNYCKYNIGIKLLKIKLQVWFYFCLVFFVLVFVSLYLFTIIKQKYWFENLIVIK